MSNEHTPGPWRAEQASSSGQVHILAEVNGHDRAIAMDVWNDCDEMEANVRLICAAPDLLEALEDCVLQWDDELPEERCLNFIGRARAAIANARGTA
ncbi:hypothetical protein [Stutzerimonas nitrititolerans]|uniref:hypothetical protein n=1 Tax=Stutzerimonas nitrititolerans TaxID=2482751 RepID=UPI0028AFF9FB|nr:hypothetical protein [Stutzerimonas nitrititolerans]